MMLIIDNVIKHILYMCIGWVYYISLNIPLKHGCAVYRLVSLELDQINIKCILKK
jgi:hypothetical protein